MKSGGLQRQTTLVEHLKDFQMSAVKELSLTAARAINL